MGYARERVAEQGGQRRGCGTVTDDGLGRNARVKGTARVKEASFSELAEPASGRSVGAGATELEEEAWALWGPCWRPGSAQDKGCEPPETWGITDLPSSLL